MADEPLQKILERLDNHEKRISSLEHSGQHAEETAIPGEENIDDPNLVLSIVNKIGDCDETEKIQKRVLDKRSMEARIMLCFYISHKYSNNAWLTTGDIEKITSELGIKIDKRNSTNKMKDLRQYLESGSARRKGQPTPYRLNRQGVKRFEEILNAA